MKTFQKLALMICLILVIIACTFFNPLLNQYKQIKKLKLRNNLLTGLTNHLIVKNDSLQKKLSKYQELVESIKNSKHTFYVTVTMYNAETSQTDNSPLITADNTYLGNRIDTLKYIAISRDLHKRYGGPFNFGDKVLLLNSGHKIGIYEIRDIMNRRFKRYIDILEPTNTKRQYKFRHAFIISLDEVNNINQYTDLFDNNFKLKG